MSLQPCAAAAQPRSLQRLRWQRRSSSSGSAGSDTGTSLPPELLGSVTALTTAFIGPVTSCAADGDGGRRLGGGGSISSGVGLCHGTAEVQVMMVLLAAQRVALSSAKGWDTLPTHGWGS